MSQINDSLCEVSHLALAIAAVAAGTSCVESVQNRISTIRRHLHFLSQYIVSPDESHEGAVSWIFQRPKCGAFSIAKHYAKH